MKPYYERAGVTLYHGKAEDILPVLRPCCADALVTDPPFGIGFAYDGVRERTSDPDAYWSWFSPILDQALQRVVPGGFVAIWQTQLYFPFFWRWYGSGIHIYCAAKNFVQLRKTPINHAYDPVVMWYTGGQAALRPSNPPRNVDFFVADTASAVSNRRTPESGHPCPRPLGQVREILANFVHPNGVVLDPFAGSGTTLRAAKNLGMRAVGIEANEAYCEITARRLSQEVLPLDGAA